MKLTCTPTDFAHAVSSAVLAVPARPSMAALGGIRIEATEASTVLAGFDWDRSTRATVVAEVITEDVVLVSGRALAAVAKALPKRAKKLTVVADDETLIITAGATRFTLPMLAVGDYPTLPEPGPTIGTLPALDLRKVFGHVSYAALTEDLGTSLMMQRCVRLRSDGGTLTCTANDRYTAAQAGIDWDGEDFDTQVYVDDITAALRSLYDGGDITIGYGGGSIALSTDAQSTTMRTVDGDYPPVDKLFAERYCSVVKVIASELLPSLRTAVAVAERGLLPHVDIEITGSVITITSTTVVDVITIDGMLDGPDVEIRLNAAKLAAAIAALDSSEVYLCFNEDTRRPIGIFPAGQDIHITAGYVVPPTAERSLVVPVRK